MAKKKNHQRLSKAACERELAIARSRWGARLSPALQDQLALILARTGLRVSATELQLIDCALYVNHAGLLRLASLRRCAGIQTQILEQFSDPARGHWVVQANILRSSRSKTTFAGLGDASPDNVSLRFRGSELRIAETRAVNRALRKAYAVGLCSTDELEAPSEDELILSSRAATGEQPSKKGDDSVFASASLHSGVPSGSDRLKLLIREHQLDPGNVRQYACRFLGIADVRQATEVQLARLLAHLEQFAIASPTCLRSELERQESPSEAAENARKTEASKTPSLVGGHVQ